MKKLKFLLLGLCMIVALMACDVEPKTDADSAVSAPDPITIKSRTVTLEDATVYSVSHDGKSAISSTGVMYVSDSSVSEQKKVYKSANSEQFIGFEGEGLGPVKFFMAATKDELFKEATKKVVKSPSPTWKDDYFTNKVTGRVYTSGAKKVVFTAVITGPDSPKKYMFKLDGSVDYELVKIYSATQGWWKTADGTAFYAIAITKEGALGELDGIAATTNVPIFTGTPTIELAKVDTSSTFLSKVMGKTAVGFMGNTITVSYSWNANGKVLTFDMGFSAPEYSFEESSDENIGVYGADPIMLSADGKTGTYGGLGLTFGTFESFVLKSVTKKIANSDERIGKTAKGKNAAGGNITYSWSADGRTVTVVDGDISTPHVIVIDSATNALNAKYGTTVLSLDPGYPLADKPAGLGGKFGNLSFTFDVVAP